VRDEWLTWGLLPRGEGLCLSTDADGRKGEPRAGMCRNVEFESTRGRIVVVGTLPVAAEVVAVGVDGVAGAISSSFGGSTTLGRGIDDSVDVLGSA
jgi:hypothetical protein